MNKEELYNTIFESFYIKKRRKLHESGFHNFIIEGVIADTKERILISDEVDVIVMPQTNKDICMEIPKNDTIHIWCRSGLKSRLRVTWCLDTFRFEVAK